jgi:anti-anti-sigma factor
MRVKFNKYQHGEWIVLEWSGRIDSFTKPDFEQHLKQAFQSESKKIAIDLRAVEFIALAMISTIVKFRKKLQIQQRDLVVIQPSVQLMRHLKVYTGPFELMIFKNFSDFEAWQPLEFKVENSIF